MVYITHLSAYATGEWRFFCLHNILWPILSSPFCIHFLPLWCVWCFPERRWFGNKRKIIILRLDTRYIRKCLLRCGIFFYFFCSYPKTHSVNELFIRNASTHTAHTLYITTLWMIMVFGGVYGECGILFGSFLCRFWRSDMGSTTHTLSVWLIFLDIYINKDIVFITKQIIRL